MRRSIAFLCIGFLVVALLIGAYAELGPALLVAIVFIAVASAVACSASRARCSCVRKRTWNASVQSDPCMCCAQLRCLFFDGGDSMREILSNIFTWTWFSEPHRYNFNGYLIRHAEGNLCIDPIQPSEPRAGGMFRAASP